MIQDFLIKHLQFPNALSESYDLSGAKLVVLWVAGLLALGLVVWKRIIVPVQGVKQRDPSPSRKGKRFHWLDAATLLALAAPMFFIMKLGVSSYDDVSSLYHVSVTHPLIACAALFLVWLCAMKFDSTLACILVGAVTIMGALGLPGRETLGSGSMPVVVWDFPKFESGDATRCIPRKFEYLQVKSGPKFGRLIKRIKLAGYQPSQDWLEVFSTFGKQGIDDLKELARDDTELPAVLDAVVKHKFGISENLSSGDAWSVLEFIEQQATLAGKYDHSMAEYAAAKLLAPYLDTQQVVNELMASIESMPSQRHSCYLASRAEREGTRKEKDDDFPLKVLRHVARVIDEDLNEKSLGDYSVFEQQFGDAWFSRDPPQPQFYRNNYFRLSRSTFGSPMADAFVKGQALPSGATVVSKALGNDHWISDLASKLGLTLPVGEKKLLGGAYVDSWQLELMFLDTPTGREYRENNQKELLDIAIRSVGPSEKKADSKDRDRMLWAGALRSQLNQSDSTSTRVVPHLGFLFLDLEARKRSNTALDPDSPS